MKRWNNPLSWSGHSVGMLAYLALFPGFFFYHTLLGLGAIGAFLGGYFAPVSLLVVGPLTFFYVYRIRRDCGRVGRADLLFSLYIGYFLCVVAIQAIAGANRVIVSNHILGILFIVNCFFMFRLVDFGRRDVWLAGLITLFGMSAIVFAFSVDGSFYLAPLGTAKNPDSLATYQGFSRSYLVTFAAVIAFTRPLPLRVLLYCLAAPTLFVNTARSEFVAMLFLIPIIELYYSQRKLLLISVLAVLFLMSYHYLDDILALLPNNRILELLDLSQSTSANKRHHLSVYALNTIAHFPVFGDYASYSPGFYSHNVLSAWVDTGAFGFLFVLALLILPLAQMLLRGYFHGKSSGQFILAFALACITLLLLAKSHYFTDMLIGASLGSYSRYRYGRKNDPYRAPDLCPSTLRHADLRQAVP
ncbi:MAG: hypothetical protein V4484_10770 [Pseudomonadota bacterium]